MLAMASACSSSLAPSGNAPSAGYVGKTLWIDSRPTTVARLNPAPLAAQLAPVNPASAKDYEYVINYYGSYATIVDYPEGTKAVGYIKNVGGQGCTNVLHGYGRKIVWIVAGQDQISEYRVPKKLLKTLSVSYNFPSSCAMDPKGNLAVGILYSAGSGSGDVVIFQNATGTPTAYATPLGQEFFDGYDNKGDLFADGYASDGGGFRLVELPKGTSKFVTIQTSNKVLFPGSVQWDGQYITVFDQDAGATYRYTVSGTTATLAGTVQLSGAGDCAQTWIVKGLLYCGDAGNNNGEAFAYPAGGSPVATFTGKFDFPLGVTAAER